MLGGETRGVVAQEHEAGDVFKGLRLGVAAQLLLAHERACAGDSRLVVAATRHDLGHPLGVAPLGRVAPGDIAAPAVGISAAGRDPALEMLPAHRDLQGFGGVRREGCQRLAHAPPIDELGGLAGLNCGIARVGGVDGAERALQSIGHGEKGRRVVLAPSHARRSRKRPNHSLRRCLARRSRYCRGPRRAPPGQHSRGGRTKEWRATFA